METQSVQSKHVLTSQNDAAAVMPVKTANKSEVTPFFSNTAEKSNTLEKVELSPENLEKVVQQLQDFMGEMNRSLQFKVDEDSGRNVIKVIDKESGDLVKQYPSEEVLGIVAKLAEATGVLVDFKV